MIEYIALVASTISTTLIVISLFLLKKTWRYYRSLRSIETSKTIQPVKPRKRYVVFTVISNDVISIDDIEESIRSKFSELYGKSTLHKASPHLILFDESSKRGVFRVTHLFVNHLIASMGSIKSIKGIDCLIIPLRTTGTLKKARRYMDKLTI